MGMWAFARAISHASPARATAAAWRGQLGAPNQHSCISSAASRPMRSRTFRRRRGHPTHPQLFRSVQKGAENGKSAPFWIWHWPPMAFQRIRPVQKGAKNGKSAPFWIWHWPLMAFQRIRPVQKGAENGKSAPFRIRLLAGGQWMDVQGLEYVPGNFVVFSYMSIFAVL